MSTGYGWEGIRQVCATLLGARHVPERLWGGSVFTWGVDRSQRANDYTKPYTSVRPLPFIFIPPYRLTSVITWNYRTVLSVLRSGDRSRWDVCRQILEPAQPQHNTPVTSYHREPVNQYIGRRGDIPRDLTDSEFWMNDEDCCTLCYVHAIVISHDHLNSSFQQANNSRRVYCK